MQYEERVCSRREVTSEVPEEGVKYQVNHISGKRRGCAVRGEGFQY